MEPTAFRILRFLRDEAVAGRGWRRRGVRGWHFYTGIEEALRTRIPEVLPWLWRRGYLDRTRVEDPGRTRPVFLYRISAAGSECVPDEEGTRAPLGEPLPEDKDPDAGTLYIPRYPWRALETLRRQASHEGGPTRFGQAGWMSPQEIGRALGQALGEDLAWLVARGLAERRAGPQFAGRGRPAWFYRASDLALGAEPVDAVRIGSKDPALVQVRVRPAEPK